MINALSFLPLLSFLELNVTGLKACKNIAAAATDIDLQKEKNAFNARTNFVMLHQTSLKR